MSIGEVALLMIRYTYTLHDTYTVDFIIFDKAVKFYCPLIVTRLYIMCCTCAKCGYVLTVLFICLSTTTIYLYHTVSYNTFYSNQNFNKKQIVLSVVKPNSEQPDTETINGIQGYTEAKANTPPPPTTTVKIPTMQCNDPVLTIDPYNMTGQSMQDILPDILVWNETCLPLKFPVESLPRTALASHPGSGNTWTRNLIQQLTGEKLKPCQICKNLVQIRS